MITIRGDNRFAIAAYGSSRHIAATGLRKCQSTRISHAPPRTMHTKPLAIMEGCRTKRRWKRCVDTSSTATNGHHRGPRLCLRSRSRGRTKHGALNSPFVVGSQVGASALRPNRASISKVIALSAGRPRSDASTSFAEIVGPLRKPSNSLQKCCRDFLIFLPPDRVIPKSLAKKPWPNLRSRVV
jgi:hypothetical protein